MLNNQIDAIPVYVTGADIDRLVKRLTKGDRVLVEMNGIHLCSSPNNAIVSNERWVVMRNTKNGITLRHPLFRHDLILPYANLQMKPKDSTVFLIHDKILSTGPIFCILQFVSSIMLLSDVCKIFPPIFNCELLTNPATRRSSINGMIRALSVLVPGWGYLGIYRFAIRTGVSSDIIGAFKCGDVAFINALSDSVLHKVSQGILWLSHFTEQGKIYNIEEEYKSPSKF